MTVPALAPNARELRRVTVETGRRNAVRAVQSLISFPTIIRRPKPPPYCRWRISPPKMRPSHLELPCTDTRPTDIVDWQIVPEEHVSIHQHAGNSARSRPRSEKRQKRTRRCDRERVGKNCHCTACRIVLSPIRPECEHRGDRRRHARPAWCSPTWQAEIGPDGWVEPALKQTSRKRPARTCRHHHGHMDGRNG